LRLMSTRKVGIAAAARSRCCALASGKYAACRRELVAELSSDGPADFTPHKREMPRP
jgi:hypothetical protein